MKRWLRTLHRWIGLTLALPVALQGLTGATLVIGGLLPEARAATQGVSRPIGAIVAAATAGHEDLRPSRYLPGEPGRAARVYLSPRSGQPRRATMAVEVDPVTLAVLGREGGGGFMDVVRRFHTNFLLEEWGGRQINGWVGLGLLALAVSGIPIWWPVPGRIRGAFTFDRRSRGWRLQRGLHGATGGWTMIVLIISAGTGAALAFPQTVRGALGLAPGGPGRAPAIERIACGAPADVDTLVDLARRAAPGLDLRGVIFPARDAEATRITFAPPGAEGVTPITMVTVDQWARRVIGLQSPETQAAGERIFRTTHDLHEAVGFGTVWRGLTIVAGLALPLFAATGWWMWLLRQRNRKRVARAASDAQRSVI